MPSPDRKPRARHADPKSKLSHQATLEAIRKAVGDPEAWAKVRPLAVRSLQSGTVTAEQAGKIVDAFWRRPLWMGLRPPRDAGKT